MLPQNNPENGRASKVELGSIPRMSPNSDASISFLVLAAFIMLNSVLEPICKFPLKHPLCSYVMYQAWLNIYCICVFVETCQNTAGSIQMSHGPKCNSIQPGCFLEGAAVGLSRFVSSPL